MLKILQGSSRIYSLSTSKNFEVILFYKTKNAVRRHTPILRKNDFFAEQLGNLLT
ncbi:hypothetical protein GJA_2633 [Janthinobacterium agaricidamnosum NBRC 102515 = DSM 9628]|uniref:Uncharacterized protein n=1 Tax=Janthinobacterium agaricidamnosum NBRC 102515 = DSM 9628 TaxID=1349767 RepID=W0V7D1_9BURK|nr:hypothetical protein GJA_2633 [Janthinobacterium agaricidamnosum NBRC 102515 = DSM 9628]